MPLELEASRVRIISRRWNAVVELLDSAGKVTERIHFSADGGFTDGSGLYWNLDAEHQEFLKDYDL